MWSTIARPTPRPLAASLVCIDFKLGVRLVQPAERPDSEQDPSAARAEERDRRVHETVGVQRVHVTRRSHFAGKRQVALQERSNVVGPWIADGDHETHSIAAGHQVDGASADTPVRPGAPGSSSAPRAVSAV